MKKVYVKAKSYLTHSNVPDGQEGGGGGGTDAPPAGGTPPAPAPAPQAPATVDWRDSIPQEYANDPRFKEASSLVDVLKAYGGVTEAPALPETYTLPEGVPEEVKEWGKEAGLTQEQFDLVLNKYGSVEASRLEGVKVANKQGFDQLVESWGEESKANLQLADRVIQFADPKGDLKLAEFLQGPQSNYAATNPMIVQLFLNIGKAMSEGGALVGDPVPGNTTGKKVHYAHELYPDNVPKK